MHEAGRIGTLKGVYGQNLPLFYGFLAGPVRQRLTEGWSVPAFKNRYRPAALLRTPGDENIVQPKHMVLYRLLIGTQDRNLQRICALAQ